MTFACHHLTVLHCSSRLGVVRFPKYAVTRAYELAEEVLRHEKVNPSKTGTRLKLSSDENGEKLFLMGEISCMLLYKCFENKTPPYTNNGA